MNREEIIKNIEKYMQKVNKQAGKELISFAGGASYEIQKSGLPIFDDVTGGIAYGGYTMLYGPEGGGKTTTAYHIIAQAQRDGKICAYIDAERSFLDGTWARKCGVDTEQLVLVRPNSAETALDEIINLSKLGVNLVVFDSVVALATEKEIDKRETPLEDHKKSEKYIDLQSEQPALLPRQLSKWFAKSVGILADNNTAVVFINQRRTNLGGFIASESFPGGNAIKHYLMLGIRVSKDKDDNVNYKVWKTRLNSNEKVQFSIPFIKDKGLDRFTSALNALLFSGKIKQDGNKFTYKVQGEDPKTVTYMGNLKNALQSLFDELDDPYAFIGLFEEIEQPKKDE